jgi:hypothetical protein
MTSLFDQLKEPPRPDPTLAPKVRELVVVKLEEGDLSVGPFEAWLFARPFDAEFQRTSPCDCPLACYLRQLLTARYPRAYFKIAVNSTRVQISSDGDTLYYDLDPVFCNFIKRVDAGGYTQILARDAVACLQAARKAVKSE